MVIILIIAVSWCSLFFNNSSPSCVTSFDVLSLNKNNYRDTLIGYFSINIVVFSENVYILCTLVAMAMLTISKLTKNVGMSARYL